MTTEKVHNGQILELFRESDDPALSTSEVAASLPITRRATLDRLKDLTECSPLEKKSIGSRNTVWYIPHDQKPEPDTTMEPDVQPDDEVLVSTKTNETYHRIEDGEDACGHLSRGTVSKNVRTHHGREQIDVDYGESLATIPRKFAEELGYEPCTPCFEEDTETFADIKSDIEDLMSTDLSDGDTITKDDLRAIRSWATWC